MLYFDKDNYNDYENKMAIQGKILQATKVDTNKM